METVNMDVLKDVWTVISSAVTIASIIVKITPNTSDDKVLANIIKFISLAPKSR